jgi:hypothetical protein
MKELSTGPMPVRGARDRYRINDNYTNEVSHCGFPFNIGTRAVTGCASSTVPEEPRNKSVRALRPRYCAVQDGCLPGRDRKLKGVDQPSERHDLRIYIFRQGVRGTRRFASGGGGVPRGGREEAIFRCARPVKPCTGCSSKNSDKPAVILAIGPRTI